MTTTKELYHQIENIEGQAARRDLTDQEFDQITKLQDQIQDIEHPGYEMKEIYEDDTLTFYVFCRESGVPVDNFQVQAEQVLSKWFA